MDSTRAETPARSNRANSVVGCLLGTAVGDALGLVYEGLGPRRAALLYGAPDRHRFLFGRGMVSDDTEHTLIVSRCLISSRGDPDLFERDLATRLRRWLLSVPAGVGWATLRAALKLCLGFPPHRSGVFSAGNGPAMRSAILGVAAGESPERLSELVFRSTRITHTDPKAFDGAIVVALAAHSSAAVPHTTPDRFLAEIDRCFAVLTPRDRSEIRHLMARAADSAARGESVSAFAASIGSANGISGYIFHTVPCVIQTWLRHQDDFAGGIGEIITAGGDTDTAAAILGGIIGARVGKAGIPPPWLDNLLEWPCTPRWMEDVGRSLAARSNGEPDCHPPRYFFPAVPLRNLLFFCAVLFHGLRRLAPPY